jgi:hypothetical protein
MNYQILHDSIINGAISKNRKRGNGEYYEQHHILPKCMGGTNHKSNLVLLTAREHFIVHKILPIIYPDFQKKLSLALHRMAFSRNKKMDRSYRIGAREFERIRKEVGIAISGENNPFSGKKHKEVSLQIIRDKTKERLSKPENHPLFNQPRSEETKEKISKANTGRKTSDETRKKMSEQRAGKPKSRQHVINQANSIRGLKRTEETKNKLRIPKPKYKCEHCEQVIGGRSNLHQHLTKKHGIATGKWGSKIK